MAWGNQLRLVGPGYGVGSRWNGCRQGDGERTARLGVTGRMPRSDWSGPLSGQLPTRPVVDSITPIPKNDGKRPMNGLTEEEHNTQHSQPKQQGPQSSMTRTSAHAKQTPSSSDIVLESHDRPRFIRHRRGRLRRQREEGVPRPV